MENPLWKVYETADNAILYGVNKAVQAWNWTTGRTKVDLANELLTVAPILESSGYILSFGGVYGAIISGVYIGISHIDQERNKKIESLEEKAKESGCLDYRVLTAERHDRNWGTAWGALGTVDVIGASISTKDNEEYGRYMFAAGHLIRSLSHYVMRAESLPPRKNVLSRAKVKLAEKLKTVKLPDILPQPAPQEIRIPIRANYGRKSLEQYF